MKKEVIFAIISGSVLGLVIAFGVWRANIAFKTATSSKSTPKPQALGQKKDLQNEFDFTIASPKNDFISTSSTTSVTGVSKPNSPIAIVGQDEDFLQTSDTKGAFKVEVDLSAGINLMKIISFDPNDGSSQESLRVIYSSEFAKFLEEKAEPKGDEKQENKKESTKEADPVREKVKEKLAEIVKNPTAFIGTITDITDNTIQLKDDQGEIQQVSVSDKETEYLKLGSETKKIEVKDVAIGDYIAALGFKNGNNVLEGKRILVTAKPEETKYTAILGEVTKVDKKILTIKDNKEKEWKVEFAKKWAGPNLKEVEESQKIIVVGLPEGSSLSSTRTLYILEEEEVATKEE